MPELVYAVVTEAPVHIAELSKLVTNPHSGAVHTAALLSHFAEMFETMTVAKKLHHFSMRFTPVHLSRLS